MFYLICAWINGWVNSIKSGDLRCHRAHYDVIVMPLRSTESKRQSASLLVLNFSQEIIFIGIFYFSWQRHNADRRNIPGRHGSTADFLIWHRVINNWDHCVIEWTGTWKQDSLIYAYLRNYNLKVLATCSSLLTSWNICLTLKHRETYECVVSTVATDTLVLKHQAISIQNAD